MSTKHFVTHFCYTLEDENMNENVDFAAEIFKAVESSYGKPVKRIVKFQDCGKHGFKLNIIFTDYRILEAKVKVETVLGEPCITLEGTYY